MRKTIALCLLILAACNCRAQQTDSVSLFVYFLNSMTHEVVKNVEVSVMTIDSIPISKATTRGQYSYWVYSMPRYYNVQLKVPRTIREYILTVDNPGYHRFSMRRKADFGKREDMAFLPTCYLTPKSEHEIKTVGLDEVTVKASKIKMVMHGDTLVYNADAFQLSNGSMLDELIRRLPGVQLKGDQITVNGRFVSSLLVNGDDFFSGDPGVALQNLPAYTVKNVKVYERQDELDRFAGKKKRDGEEPLVMDVSLKKEYMEGWIANADMGGGPPMHQTDKHESWRWTARLFALRYTKNSRLGLFTSMNNINDTRSPGTNGEWSSNWQASGATTLRKAGVNYQFNDNAGHIRFSNNTFYIYQKANNNSMTATQQFIDGGDRFSRNTTGSIVRQKKIGTENKLELTWTRFMLRLTPWLNYATNDNRSSSLSATFAQNPMERYRNASLDSIFTPSTGMGTSASARLDSILVNRIAQRSHSFNKQLRTRMGVGGSWMLPKTSDFLRIEQSTVYNWDEEKTHSLYGLNYHDGTGDYRNKYSTDKRYSLHTSGEVLYLPTINSEVIAYFWPKYTYTHSYNNGDYNLYRLDRYGQYRSQTERSLHVLPSTSDSLQQARDIDNSYHSRQYSDGQTLKASIYLMLHKQKRIGIEFNPSLSYRHDKIKYERGGRYLELSQHGVFFEPTVSLHRDGDKNSDITYSFSSSMPSLTNQLAYTDDRNPLYIWTGNPGLRNTTTHEITAYTNRQMKGKRGRWRLSFNWQVVRNAVGNYTVYNRTTGVSHTTPRNINGNWNVNGGLYLVRSLDKNQHWMLTEVASASFTNSVDYVSVEELSAESPRSSVRNSNFYEHLKLDYSRGRYAFGLKVDVGYLHAQSPRQDFEQVNTANVSYGLNANVELPWQIKVSTDLTLYSRYGYSDRTMNTNNLVWNGSVKRTFGNFTFMLDGFDMLGKLSNVRRSINAQGRTEVWYNTVPSYVMLHMVYRLHVKPKGSQ